MHKPNWIKERLYRLNQEEYAGHYNELNWITDQKALQASDQREAILKKLRDNVHFDYRDTKIFYAH